MARFLLDDIVAPLAASEAPATEVIESILKTFCDAIATHPDHVRVWLGWGVSRRAGVREPFKAFYRLCVLAMAQLIERGQPDSSIEPALEVDAAARVLVGLAHMIVQMKFSGSRRDDITHTVHSLVHGYLAGHGARTRTLRT